MNSLTQRDKRARKIGGSYQAEGTIVGEFYTLADQYRYVFEFDEPKGMLHIFNEDQIELIHNDPESGNAA